MSETWLEYMTRRGWTQKVIHRYAIGGATYFDGRPCLKYVTISMSGQKAYRARFFDGQLPKIKWFGNLEDGQKGVFDYYSPGGLCAAIQKADGLLYWCSGEADVWTLYQALEIENATCSFGEGTIPDTIIDDLKGCGVKSIVMYPDLDEKGFYAAWKLLKALSGSGIGLFLWRLPAEMQSKFDLNRLWQKVNFNVNDFQDVLLNKCQRLEEMDLELYVPADRPKQSKGGTETLPLQTSFDFGGLFAEWIDEIIRSLGAPDVREGRIERWHCPVPPHDDKHPSFRVATGKNCKMPMCTCGIQDLDPTDAWNKVAAAKGVENWQEYKTRKLAETGRAKPIIANTASANGAVPVAPDLEPLWVDSHTIYNQLLDHLEGTNIPDIDFIECPLEVLHEFGGFAEVMFPGKLVYIVGISGGGKTSLGETMAEKLQRQGYDFVWYGPEWSPYEMGLRSLQRARGADMISMAKHFQYSIQAQKGVPEAKRKGVPLNDEQTVRSNKAVLDMANWPGRSYFLTAKANLQPLSQMLDTVRALVRDRRAAGRKVVAFFFDYLQRANKSGRNNAFWSEEVIAEIKALCEELQLVGFVMVQPKKGDSEGVRDGDTLTEASGQGISDQQCNLYLAISPKYDAGIKTGYSSIKIVKNSMGRMGEINVQNDYEHLLIIDKKARVVTTNLKEGQ